MHFPPFPFMHSSTDTPFMKQLGWNQPVTVLPCANIGAPTRILFFSIFVKQLVSLHLARPVWSSSTLISFALGLDSEFIFISFLMMPPRLLLKRQVINVK